jgi:transcription antitermination factor NusG
MSARNETNSVVTVPSGVGSAVGVAKSNWFVAVVKNNTEKAVLERMLKLGYECYVPIQKEIRIWRNGKRAIVDRVVIPSLVFIHCTEAVRRDVVSLPFIIRFLTNRAGSSPEGLNKPLAIIPDSQIRTLQFMVGNSDTPVTFTPCIYRQGDKIRVIRGNLKGLEGEVQVVDDRHSELSVVIGLLGSAKLTIDTVDVELIK